MAFICDKFGDAYPSIRPRITRTLLRALLDTKPMTTHYGAIRGLHALGPKVVRETVMPNLRAYLNALEPSLEPPTPRDPSALEGVSEEERNTAIAKAKLAVIRHSDAQRVMGALQDAVGACVRDEVGAAEDRARESRLADQLMRWRRTQDGDRFEKDVTAAVDDDDDEPASPTKRASKAAATKAKTPTKAVVPKAPALVRSRRARRGATPDDGTDAMGDVASAHAPNVTVSETHV
jgi:transcription initiation factor TFIID subunit 6